MDLQLVLYLHFSCVFFFWDDFYVCLQSGVHTHMTNTRITDPEIVERRYPMLVREFNLRRGSGGAGRYRGGDGVVREFEFLTDLSVGILSERRSFAPCMCNRFF